MGKNERRPGLEIILVLLDDGVKNLAYSGDRTDRLQVEIALFVLMDMEELDISDTQRVAKAIRNGAENLQKNKRHNTANDMLASAERLFKRLANHHLDAIRDICAALPSWDGELSVTGTNPLSMSMTATQRLAEQYPYCLEPVRTHIIIELEALKKEHSSYALIYGLLKETISEFTKLDQRLDRRCG